MCRDCGGKAGAHRVKCALSMNRRKADHDKADKDIFNSMPRQIIDLTGTESETFPYSRESVTDLPSSVPRSETVKACEAPVKYHKRDKEKQKIYQAKYHARNKEKIKVYQAQWQARHRQRIIERRNSLKSL